MAGRSDQALETIDEIIAALVERNGDMFMMPELQRIKADILTTLASPDFRSAEDCLLRSLELAGRQSALAWELRTATSLARLWLMQDRFGEALDVLAPVVGRFTEGFESSDLKAARELLDKLKNHSPIKGRDGSVFCDQTAAE